MINRTLLKHGITAVIIAVLGLLALGSSATVTPTASASVPAPTGEREDFRVKVEYHIEPEIGVEAVANIGDTIFAKEWRKASVDYIRVNADAQIFVLNPGGKSSNGYPIPVQDGLYKPLFKQGNSIIYTDDGALAEINGRVSYRRDGSFYELLSLSSHIAGYTRETFAFDTSDEPVKKELIFTGVSGSTITLSYNESGRLIPIVVTYDMAKDKIIGYGGAAFEVVEYNNRSIKYKVISGFETPQEQGFMTPDQVITEARK
jgi:hypothetical protein